VPLRSPDFAHLTLDSLRGYRRALAAEENRVSYWRRLIQARLDMLDNGETPADDRSHDRLRTLLAEARGHGRQALVSVVPTDAPPPLPDLESLWTRELRLADALHTAELRRELSFAELQLSAYRAALHRRLTASTAELIARYREDPSLALTALPLPRSSRS
jgi:hypothetical protein